MFYYDYIIFIMIIIIQFNYIITV